MTKSYFEKTNDQIEQETRYKWREIVQEITPKKRIAELERENALLKANIATLEYYLKDVLNVKEYMTRSPLYKGEKENY